MNRGPGVVDRGVVITGGCLLGAFVAEEAFAVVEGFEVDEFEVSGFERCEFVSL